MKVFHFLFLKLYLIYADKVDEWNEFISSKGRVNRSELLFSSCNFITFSLMPTPRSPCLNVITLFRPFLITPFKISVPALFPPCPTYHHLPWLHPTSCSTHWALLCHRSLTGWILSISSLDLWLPVGLTKGRQQKEIQARKEKRLGI